MSAGTVAPVIVAPAAPSLLSTTLDRIFWVALVLGGIYFWSYLHGDHVGPEPVVDTTFVKIGQEYPKRLGQIYGGAWSDGASALESGKSIKDSLDVVTKSWSDGRTKAFEDTITPAMSKIVAENQTDLSSSERSAMVRAWRGLAKGMGK